MLSIYMTVYSAFVDVSRNIRIAENGFLERALEKEGHTITGKNTRGIAGLR